MNIPTNWAEADTGLGKRESRKVGNNTYVQRRHDGSIAVVLHGTDVATFTADGDIILKDRVNAALPTGWYLGSERGTWYLYRREGHAPILPFASGIAVRADGSIGMATRGHVDTLLTADQVDEIVTTTTAARDAREAARLARLAAQHPTPRPVTYRAGVPHAPYALWQPPLPSPHGRSRTWDCPSCRAEADEWHQIVRDALAADHDNGHAWSDGVSSFPPRPCPWDCPKHVR